MTRSSTALPAIFCLACSLLAGCVTPYGDEPKYRPASLDQTGVDDTAPPAGGESIAPAGTAAPAGALTVPGAATEPMPLTLDECLQLAHQNSRSLQIADRRVLIAQARVTEAWSNFVPKLSASGRFETRSNDRGGKLGTTEFVMGDQEVFTGGIHALVPLYTFGRVRNLGDAESLRSEVAEFDAQRTLQNLDLAVSAAYFRILEAEKIRGVVDDSILVVTRQMEISRDFYTQGLVAKTDVLSAEVQLANRRQERIQAHNNAQLATATLNRLMGIDVDRPTRVADVLEMPPWRGSYQGVLRAAIERRPDLEALKHRIEIARADWRFTRASNLPYLYGFGDYSYTSDSFLLNKDWLAAGVVLEFPFFDVTNYLKMRRQKLEIAEAVDLHDDRVDDVVLEVKRTFLNVREAAERIPVARKAIEEAEENLRMIRDQYSQGLVTVTDVLIEEDRRSRARSNYYQALYDYHDSFARLTNVIAGKPPEEGSRFPGQEAETN